MACIWVTQTDLPSLLAGEGGPTVADEGASIASALAEFRRSALHPAVPAAFSHAGEGVLATAVF